VQVYDAKKRVGDTAGKPGEVTAVSADGFTIAAQGGSIEVHRVRPAGGNKITAAEFIRAAGLQKGAQLSA
jgi:methionyl-tRNA formyltransferase